MFLCWISYSVRIYDVIFKNPFRIIKSTLYSLCDSVLKPSVTCKEIPTQNSKWQSHLNGVYWWTSGKFCVRFKIITPHQIHTHYVKVYQRPKETKIPGIKDCEDKRFKNFYYVFKICPSKNKPPKHKIL